MKTRYFLLAWLASAALAFQAAAQDEAAEPPAGQAGQPNAETADDAGEAGEETGAEAEGEADAEAEAEELEEREFIFSEEIPADQQVTFPVDI